MTIGGTKNQMGSKNRFTIFFLFALLLTSSEIVNAKGDDDDRRRDSRSNSSSTTHSAASQFRSCIREALSGITSARSDVHSSCRRSRRRATDNTSCQQAQAALEIAKDELRDKLSSCRNGGSAEQPEVPTTPEIPQAPQNCQINGQTVAHGQSITLFQMASVAANQMCVSQARTCSNGTLSGSYTFASCTAQAAPAIDGAALYTQNCALCHGDLANSERRGSSASKITSAISSVSAMKSRPAIQALTPAEISAIALALGGK